MNETTNEEIEKLNKIIIKQLWTIDHLTIALKDIRKHQCIVAGSLAPLSTTWFIANRALESEARTDNG